MEYRARCAGYVNQVLVMTVPAFGSQVETWAGKVTEIEEYTKELIVMVARLTGIDSVVGAQEQR